MPQNTNFPPPKSTPNLLETVMPCNCENVAHIKEDGCKNHPQIKVLTVFGTFNLCIGCFQEGHMTPDDFDEPDFDPDERLSTRKFYN